MENFIFCAVTMLPVVNHVKITRSTPIPTYVKIWGTDSCYILANKDNKDFFINVTKSTGN